jgi:hypothetical protein
MTRLRRIRMDGVGPTGARFDPVTIDLTDRTGAGSRVALIHLENGGGKSVLLKLVFATVLPGRRYTIGGAKLGDFVLGDDTSHIALEWGLDDGRGGEVLLVTGTVLEWRSRTRSADQSNLRQWWYAFRPIPGVLDLELLPTRVAGRRPSRAAFRDRLIDAWHASPALELADQDSPERWRDWLLNHTPLDPELFAYQRAMNADESDAEELFSSIRSGDGFVRMLLQAVADPVEMHSFGDTLGTFAAQLARREGLERERAFAVDAVGALRPLAEAHAAVIQAAEAVAAARRDRWALQAKLAVEVARAGGEAKRLRLAAEADETAAKHLDERANQLIAQGQELRRREAEYLFADANIALAVAKLDAETAEGTAQAWKVLDTVINEVTAASDRVRLQRELEEADQKDAPLRAARDQAAGALAGRLDTEMTAAALDATRLDALAKQADETRSAADELRRQTEAEASQLRADAKANDGRSAEADAARASLVTKKVLGTDEDAAAGEERWTVTAVEAETDLAERNARRAETKGTLAVLTEEDKAHAATILEATPKLTDAEREHRRLSGLAADLAGADRLAAVLGEAGVDLWARGADLDAALSEAVTAAEAELRDLAIGSRADQLALQVLGEGGLLPPSDDVTKVWDVLTASRIPATSGWRWLAERDDPEERARLLAAQPALAGGVVITDPTRVEDAREAVTAAGLDLRSVVAVGTSGELDIPGPSAVWAAPVHRGLYDEEWARDERTRIEQRLAVGDETQERLEVQASADRSLKERLRQLFDQCPAGHLDALAATAAGLRGRLEIATARMEEISAETENLRGEDETLQRLAVSLAERVRTATGNASRCEEQARRDRQAVQWRADAADWRIQAQALDSRAGDAARAAEAARAAGETARGEAAERRRIVDGHREERGGLPVVAPAADVDSTVPTAVLRRSFQAATARLENESAGKTLAGELSVAEAREADAVKQLKLEPPVVVAQARTLLADPAAGNSGSRRESQLRTAGEATRLSGVATEAAGNVKVAQAELDARQPRGRLRWIDLPADLEPADGAQAAELARQLGEEQRKVAEDVRERRLRAGSATRAAETATSRAQVLSAHQRTLDVDDVPVDTAGVVPFDGSLEEAERLVAEQTAAHRRTTAVEETAANGLAEAVEDVRRVGRSYSGIGGHQTALAEEPSATLATRAAELARGLDAIRESIDAELAEVHKHREGLIERLSTLVEQRLKLLKLAQRTSTVPERLGDWSGKPFLTIGFQTPDDATLAQRMGAAIDEAVRAIKRDPTAIVLDAVRTAVVRRTSDGEHAFTVSIMKPNAAMFDTTVGVERLSTEFSGGQRLTAAVLLYCTMAALRAHVRGQEQPADPGVLFLDNPIGKANADYLLDLQIAVAERRGVQLVYTTGISDPEVQASFDTIARLRNDADLRRHMNYIIVDDGIAERLTAGREAADTAGYVSATRLAALPPP